MKEKKTENRTSMLGTIHVETQFQYPTTGRKDFYPKLQTAGHSISIE